MRNSDSADRLGRLADLERRYDGSPPAALLRRALHGGRFRLLHATAQSRLFDRLAGAAVAGIARRRPTADDGRLAELAADLRFCRRHGLLWKRYARENRSGG